MNGKLLTYSIPWGFSDKLTFVVFIDMLDYLSEKHSHTDKHLFVAANLLSGMCFVLARSMNTQ